MVAVSLLALSILALAGLLGPMQTQYATRLLLISLGILSFLPMGRWVLNKRFEFFEIIYPVSISYFLYFVYSAFSSLEETFVIFPWLSQIDVNQALLYVSMGFCCLLIGYYSRLPLQLTRLLPPIKLEADPFVAHTAIYVLYLLGLVIRLYLLSIGSSTWSVKMEELEYGTVVPGPAASLIGYINNCSIFAYVLACTYFFYKDRTRMLGVVLWGIMFPIECLWAFLQASKNAFIPVLVAPMIAYHVMNKKVTVRQIVIPTLLFIFLIFPAVTEYRDWADEYPVRLDNITEILPKITTRLVNNLTAPESDTFVADAPELVADRLSGLAAVANVVNYVKTNGIIHGQTLWQWYLILLPGVVAPDKDKYLNYGMLFYGVEVFGTYGEATSGVALMQAGEFFLNYGLWCLLLGMFLQGILYRVWQEYWGQNNPMALAVYILGWRMLVLIEIPFCHAYGELARQTLLMLLLIWLLPRLRFQSRVAPEGAG